MVIYPELRVHRIAVATLREARLREARLREGEAPAEPGFRTGFASASASPASPSPSRFPRSQCLPRLVQPLTLPPMSLSQDLQFAIELARGAGKIVMDHYGKVERLTKRHAEAVTDADRASQRFIVSGLRRRFPNDGVVGEENETGDAITFDVRDPRGRVWVIDPIDGTNNFIAGLGAFGVCI